MTDDSREIAQRLWQRVLMLFDQGQDTKSIADALKVKEDAAERMLHAALANRRMLIEQRSSPK